MELCIDAAQLREALRTLDAAEANGFHHCLAVFSMDSAGRMISDCRASFSDLLERAHPSDANLNWGRFQGVTRRNRFVNGRLVPIEQPANGAAQQCQHEWRIDGAHSNEFCSKCFISKP